MGFWDDTVGFVIDGVRYDMYESKAIKLWREMDRNPDRIVEYGRNTEWKKDLRVAALALRCYSDRCEEERSFALELKSKARQLEREFDLDEDQIYMALYQRLPNRCKD